MTGHKVRDVKLLHRNDLWAGPRRHGSVAFRLLHLQAVMSRPFCFLVTVDYAALEVMFQCPTPVPSLVLHSDLSLICWLTSVIITMAGPAARCAVSHIVLTAAEAHFILFTGPNVHCNCHHTYYFLNSLWLTLVPHVVCYPYYKCCLLWLINAWVPYLLNLLSCDLYGMVHVWYSVCVMKVVLILKLLKQGCTHFP